MDRTPRISALPRGKPALLSLAGRVLICATVFGTELIVSVTETPPPAVVRISGSNFSLRVIAGAIILLFCYYAQGVVITLLLSILLAYFLDPAVEILERVGIPRTAGAMVMVLILIAVLGAVGYGLGTRLSNFAQNWQKYSTVLRSAADSVEGKINGIEGRVAPGADPGPACYGKGGTLGGTQPTLTDANLLLGRLDPAYFLGGEMPLDVDAAREAINRCVAWPLGLSEIEAARAIVEIAVMNMSLAAAGSTRA